MKSTQVTDKNARTLTRMKAIAQKEAYYRQGAKFPTANVVAGMETVSGIDFKTHGSPIQLSFVDSMRM